MKIRNTSFLAWVATVLTLLALTWPIAASAEVVELPPHLAVTTSELYRLRQNQTLWQLSGELTEPITGSLPYKSRLWLIIGEPEQARLVWTDDGLTINRPSLPTAKWRLDELAGQLFASTSDQTWLLTDPDEPLQLKEYLPPSGWSVTSPNSRGEVSWLASEGPEVWKINLIGGQTDRQGPLKCLEPTFFQAVRILGCQSNELFYRSTTTGWQLLNLPTLDFVDSSERLLVGINRLDRDQLIIWQEDDIKLMRLPSLIIRDVAVFGTRVFLKTDDSWQELAWNQASAKLWEASEDPGAEIIPAEDRLFINGVRPLTTSKIGDYQFVETVGHFNHVRRIGEHWIIWQTDNKRQVGGLTQVTLDPPVKFQKIVGAWSQTTSPIQTIQQTSHGYFIIVITNSGRGRANLYSSSNLFDWKRLTLPTKPTFALTIAQARSQAVGSEVEIAGLVTVEKDQLATNAFYLEDQTGGIQIYSSVDLPEKIRYRHLQVAGEISSAKIKRLILANPQEVTVGRADRPNLPKVSLAQAFKRLGQAITVEGTVKQLENESFLIADQLDYAKVHLPNAKAKLTAGDKVELSVIPDLNSSTDNIELWSQGEQLSVSTPAPSASSSVPSAGNQSSQPTSIPTSFNLPISSPDSSASANASAPHPSGELLLEAPIAPTETLEQPPTLRPILVDSVAVQPATPVRNTQAPNNDWAIPLGLGAGALAIRGRRCQRFLNNNAVSPKGLDRN